MKIHFLCYLLLFCVTAGWAEQSSSAEQLYLEAKKLSLYQKYDQAAQLFQKLVTDFPESNFTTEAMFWIGFCYHKADEQERAFTIFDQVVENYPESSWAEDALDYQIEIAADLPQNDILHSFLHELLSHENLNVRYKVASLLLKNDDLSAIPVLEELEPQMEFDADIKALMDAQDSAAPQALEFDLSNNDEQQRSRSTVKKSRSRNDRIHYFDEKRFEQYKMLVRDDNEFTENDLLLFGMWHILPTESFSYLADLNSAEQDEWIRLYWKRQDPTPFSAENEAFDEFLRRIDFSREHYDYFDNLDGYDYAPWDARGEVYIKLGQPANRKKNNDGEIWYYPNENRLSFFIRPNVANIFGRAIYIASIEGVNAYRPATAAAWRQVRSYHNEYVFQSFFKFSLDPYFSFIDNFNLKIVEKRPQQFKARYQVPAKGFELIKRDGLYHIGYVEEYVVFDKDMNVVQQNKTQKQITRPTRRDFEKMWRLGQNIAVQIEPGEYFFYVQISDVNSDKIAIGKLPVSIGAD